MSGYADHAVVQRDIIDAGRPFLQKPFAPDRLVARVKEVLVSWRRANPMCGRVIRECRNAGIAGASADALDIASVPALPHR